MVMTNISLAQAKAKLSELLDRIEAGEEFCITRHGKPAVGSAPRSDRASVSTSRSCGG